MSPLELRNVLLNAMGRYARVDGLELLRKLQRDRIVEQVESTEPINVALELHPAYTAEDDPAVVWISAKSNWLAEHGVLLVRRDGKVEVGSEFKSFAFESKPGPR